MHSCIQEQTWTKNIGTKFPQESSRLVLSWFRFESEDCNILEKEMIEMPLFSST